MMDEKMPYHKDSRKYLNSVMKGMDQPDLMTALLDLNIHELKQCIGAGVPGDAMNIANQRLKDLKAEIKAYIDKKGSEATATVEIETTQEEKEDVVERILPPKEQRESNSGKVGKTDTDPGTA